MKTTRYSFFAVLLFLIGSAFAQAPAGTSTIRGILLDSATRKPVELATVSLKGPAKQVLKSVLTKTDGSFELTKVPAGKYGLAVIFVGYAAKTIPVEVSGSAGEVNVGPVSISSSASQLKTVSVTADRQLIKQEVDRIAYDLQADPESKVNSVLEMMRKVPMLSVDADDNITLKGNSNYKILINGKPSSMMERSPKDVLRSMPAASIQKIEVITTPPAKYDAEGVAGLINIITNKKVDNGYNGTVNASTRFPVGGPGTGESFNFKQGKFGVSAFSGANLSNTPSTALESNRNSTDGTQTRLQQYTDRKSDNTGGYLGTELSYELDSLSLLSAQFNLNGSKGTGASTQISELNGKTGMIDRYVLTNDNDVRGTGVDAALNYQKGFKKNKNRLLTFSYRYYAFENRQDNDLARVSGSANSAYRQNNNSEYGEHTVQVDYVQPAKKLSIEAGAKAIMRDNKSDFQYLVRQPDGAFKADPASSNVFNNTQKVFAAYNTYQYNLKAWGFKAGVRVENTIIDANFITNASQVQQDYFNIVPAVAINRRFRNQSSLNLGFAQRIQRPGINQLNPFVDRSNPNFESTGNPGLRPATGTNFQLGYTWTKKLSISYNISYGRINGLIFQVSSFDPATNITRTRFENTGKAEVIGNNINMNIPFSNAWTMSLNGNLNYGHAVGISNGSPISNHGLMYNANVSTNRRFEKGWRLSASLFVNGGELTIQQRGKGFTGTSFAATKDIVKDKLSLSANVANPFNKYRINTTHTFGPNYDQNNYSQQYFRSGNISLNYRFGKLKEAIKKNARGIKNDDVAN